MVKFHAKSGTYNLQLRACFSVKSEKKFRAMIESAISNQPQAVANSLRNKWENGKEFDVLSWFGVTTNKWKVE